MRCPDCTRQISDRDRRRFQEESGEISYGAPTDPDGSWPACCDDCADWSAAHSVRGVEAPRAPWQPDELQMLIFEQEMDAASG